MARVKLLHLPEVRGELVGVAALLVHETHGFLERRALLGARLCHTTERTAKLNVVLRCLVVA
jgi:hypothetical protein